ncbi:hypothetical protein H0H93_012073 [Arthromyces matolae]|nr:hypothetical protein H0H93_012073 [Arthromyces matolae]
MARNSKQKRKANIASSAFISAVQADPDALSCLASNDEPSFIKSLLRLIRKNAALRNAAFRGPPNMRTFISWCSNYQPMSDTLSTALKDRLNHVAATRFAKRDFLKRTPLSWIPQDTAKFLSSLPVIFISRPSSPYPPENYCIAESDAIYRHWEATLLTDKQPDARRKRSSLLHLDYSLLSYNLGPNESAIFRDPTTREIIAIIIRNACREPGLLDWADSIVADACKERDSIRKEDSGTLAQTGYSAGARKKGRFDWVLNLRSTTERSRTVAAENDWKSSALFAVFWQLAKNSMAPEICDDFELFLRKKHLKRMDANGQLTPQSNRGPHANPSCRSLRAAESSLKTSLLARDHYIKPPPHTPRPRIIDHGLLDIQGDYVVEINSRTFKFTNAELAPPAGVMGENYSRAIHYEKQPHKWALSWTVSRGAEADAGCHFYIAEYAI